MSAQARPSLSSPPLVAMERHFTPKEVAEMWGWSISTVLRVFREEPGVLTIQNKRGASVGRHKTLRIPQSVLERVHRRNEVK